MVKKSFLTLCEQYTKTIKKCVFFCFFLCDGWTVYWPCYRFTVGSIYTRQKLSVVGPKRTQPFSFLQNQVKKHKGLPPGKTWDHAENNTLYLSNHGSKNDRPDCGNVHGEFIGKAKRFAKQKDLQSKQIVSVVVTDNTVWTSCPTLSFLIYITI